MFIIYILKSVEIREFRTWVHLYFIWSRNLQ